MPTGSRRVTGSHDTAVHTKYGIDLGAQGAATMRWQDIPRLMGLQLLPMRQIGSAELP